MVNHEETQENAQNDTFYTETPKMKRKLDKRKHKKIMRLMRNREDKITISQRATVVAKATLFMGLQLDLG